MKKRNYQSNNHVLLLSTALLLILVTSCKTDDFKIYSDQDYAAKVEARFEERKELAVNRDAVLFDVFQEELTQNEEQGLKFLYAYMPLSDLADYDGSYFLDQVRWSLAARDTFPWGHTIPESIFRHFILPYRVNNENLDTARIVIFNELKDRIRNLSMMEAALEVNHWCHEKVTYRGTDIRTSAPLATIKTAYGRCGEESTFTVAALRSVAIPARQVYTPRWAHSDDNHAWVEFWADGEWHFMGACEPECVPNLGWFTEPARRAMLIHTKAFGDYLGDERAENRDANYALLNTLDVYAPVKKIQVKVTNPNASPAAEVTVEFQLYNYAEFYPISTKKTDDKGICSFLTGLGDLIIWAHNGEGFGFEKISVGAIDTVHIVLNSSPYQSKVLEFDLEPPIEREPLVMANDCREENNRRLQMEDSIRGAYEKSFPSEEMVRLFAEENGLDPEKSWNVVVKSRGNYQEIMTFLRECPKEHIPTAFDLLQVIAEKDLRDTKGKILNDHLKSFLALPDGIRHLTSATAISATDRSRMITTSLLNPRVANEMLIDYRAGLIEAFGSDFILATRQNPVNLLNWIRDEIQINDTENYYGTPLTPVGVYQLKVADQLSRKIFTVAVFRTFGIPARLSPGTLLPEYWFNNEWNIAHFESVKVEDLPKGVLVLTSHPDNPVTPQYETHYTLARYKGGKYHTLAYGYGGYPDPLAGPLTLDEGHYLLVTGNRMPGGRVLAKLDFFKIEGNTTKKLELILRKSDKPAEILGIINPVWDVKPLDGKGFAWDQLSRSGPAVMAWMDPDKEPTKHVIQDLALLKKELDQLSCSFIFLIPEDRLPSGFTAASWTQIPEQSHLVSIPGLTSLKEIESITNRSLSDHLPVVIIKNEAGEIIYLSSGYKIGIAEELIKAIRTMH
ncbi:MAG: transglutaminase-like domain-containing protein [Bacteroidales bacterium]|nr:transglutaminase-like domain-containing protein [Bacteroidales bacterium]